MTYIAILPNPFMSIATPRKIKRARKVLKKAKRNSKRRKA